VSNVFFELANAPKVYYRLYDNTNTDHNTSKDDNTYKDSSTNTSENTRKMVTIHQDLNNQSHTGACVWETAFLLLTFLRQRAADAGDRREPHRSSSHCKTSSSSSSSSLLGKVLEVGAGCGLLGIALGALGLCESVILTETPEVMENLKRNVDTNASLFVHSDHSHSSAVSTVVSSSCTIPVASVPPECYPLDWTALDQHIHNGPHSSLLKPHSFDTIVGTDVIFATHLVEPLVRTLILMSHESTNIYICVQIRCPDSHALFLQIARRHFDLQDISHEYLPVAPWGRSLECFLFLLTQKG